MHKFIRVDGKNDWENNQSMGDNRLYALINAIDPSDSITFEQFTNSSFFSDNPGNPPIFTTEINSGYTGNIAESPLSQKRAIRYLICIIDETNMNYTSSEILLMRKNSSYIITESAILGDNINYSISATNDGTNIYLQLLNNEATMLKIDSIAFIFG